MIVNSVVIISDLYKYIIVATDKRALIASDTNLYKYVCFIGHGEEGLGTITILKK